LISYFIKKCSCNAKRALTFCGVESAKSVGECELVVVQNSDEAGEGVRGEFPKSLNVFCRAALRSFLYSGVWVRQQS
jgi:hypothetical protein